MMGIVCFSLGVNDFSELLSYFLCNIPSLLAGAFSIKWLLFF